MREETRKLLDESIDSCLRLYACEPGEGHCVGIGIGDDIIRDMEEELGLKFSDDYIEFLRSYGETSIMDCSIYGYSGVVPMHWHSTVVQKTMHFRVDRAWPGIDDWYIVASDGLGLPIGCKPDGSVWLSDYYSNFEEEKLADSFDAFIYDLLLEQKEFEEEDEYDDEDSDDE